MHPIFAVVSGVSVDVLMPQTKLYCDLHTRFALLEGGCLAALPKHTTPPMMADDFMKCPHPAVC